MEKRPGKKWPREKKAKGKNSPWKKAEGKERKNNNLRNNFSATANIFGRNFFLRLLNLIFEPILSESSDKTNCKWFSKLRVFIIREAPPPGPTLISEHVRLGI